jgi:hypothetical protein
VREYWFVLFPHPFSGDYVLLEVSKEVYHEILSSAIQRWQHNRLLDRCSSMCYQRKNALINSLFCTSPLDIQKACSELIDFLPEDDIIELHSLVHKFHRSPKDRERIIKTINGMFERNKEAFIKIRCLGMDYEKNIAVFTEDDFKNDKDDLFD